MAAKTIATEWVDVVNADGAPYPEFPASVPSSWLGTELLPPGAVRAEQGKHASEGAASAPADDLL